MAVVGNTSVIMAKRIGYIDIAKGIGILLVVMGHNDFFTSIPFLRQFIYSFHLPLFFFLSGVFFNPAGDLIGLITKKFHSLLKPYLITLLLIFFFSVSFTKINILDSTARLVKSLYSTGYYLDWVPLWFLPHLFVLNIFTWGVFFFTKNVRLPKKGQLVLITVLLVTGLIFISQFWPFQITVLGKTLKLYGLPFSIDLILISSFYFILGKLSNGPWLEKLISSKITLLCSFVILLGSIYFMPLMLDLASRIAASIIPIVIASLAGIILILSLSKSIEIIPFFGEPLKLIGNLTLFILLFHLPIQEAWGDKIMNVTNNRIIAALVSYVFGVGIPILIGQYAIIPNAYLRSLFMEQKQDPSK